MFEQYLEDFAVGQTFSSGCLRIDEERINSFAAEFDLGVPPTGKKIHFETLDAMRVKNGKIAEHWGVANIYSLMAAGRHSGAIVVVPVVLLTAGLINEASSPRSLLY